MPIKHIKIYGSRMSKDNIQIKTPGVFFCLFCFVGCKGGINGKNKLVVLYFHEIIYHNWLLAKEQELLFVSHKRQLEMLNQVPPCILIILKKKLFNSNSWFLLFSSFKRILKRFFTRQYWHKTLTTIFMSFTYNVLVFPS